VTWGGGHATQWQEIKRDFINERPRFSEFYVC
jgi:hypothetical protein